MFTEIDLILLESLVVGASEALGDLAEELLDLRCGWVGEGADPKAIVWLDGVIAKAGWWSGRLAAAAPAR
jgi:hypothetical protein